MHAIVFEDVYHGFGRTPVLQGASFAVRTGSIFALVGKNGAGKTTALKTALNIFQPKAGSISVLGKDSRQLTAADFCTIGYVSENQELPLWMSLKTFLAFCSKLYPAWDHALCRQLCEQLELPLRQRLEDFSRGMRMKAALISALSYRPELLVLDEPFSGLDVLVRDELAGSILELVKNNHWSIIISSHEIDEIERLADTIGVLADGRLQLCSELETLQIETNAVTARGSAPEILQLSQTPPRNWHLQDAGTAQSRFIVTETAAGQIHSQLGDAHSSSIQTEVEALSLREIVAFMLKSKVQ